MSGIGMPTEYTSFTRDVLGRYVCNTFDEMLVTVDPNARAAAGLPPRGDLAAVDFIIIGGGTFGAALAEHLWFRSANRSERILVLDGGPFLLAEHVRTCRFSGLTTLARIKIIYHKMKSGDLPGIQVTSSVFRV